MTAWDEWSGEICTGCGEEVFRLLDGQCLPCGRKKEAKDQRLEERRAHLQELAKKHNLWKFPKKKTSVSPEAAT